MNKLFSSATRTCAFLVTNVLGNPKRSIPSYIDHRFLLLCLYLYHYWLHQKYFHQPYLDSDQLVMADQAAWMSRSELHEPLFFGQAYLFPFESYLAVPLIWLGVAPIIAVKFIAAVCFYAPFLWTSLATGKGNPRIAYLCLFFLLLLPLEYQLTAALPRGFVAATALAWLTIYWLKTARVQTCSNLLISGTVLGFCLSSYASVALILPALITGNKPKKLFLTGIGMVIGYFVFKELQYFYVANPDYVVHPSTVFEFRLLYLSLNLQNADILFPVARLTLLSISSCIIFWVLSRPDTTNVRSQDWYLLGASLLAAVTLIVLILSSNKIGDFEPDSPFYSIYRMIQPMPLLALLLGASNSTNNQTASNTLTVPQPRGVHVIKFWYLWVIIALTLSYKHSSHFKRTFVHHLYAPRYMMPVSVDWLKKSCGELEIKMQLSKNRYYLYEGRQDHLAYGCHAQFGMPVVQTHYERRTWLLKRLMIKQN